jgi:dolichol kinase
MSREPERDHFITAPLHLAAGVILALLIFPRNVAYASIAVVAAGDPVAALVGTRFGRIHIKEKTVEGFLAGTVASTLIASLAVPLYLASIGAVAGMLLELSDVFEDNLTVPIGAGLCMLIAQLRV